MLCKYSAFCARQRSRRRGRCAKKRTHANTMLSVRRQTPSLARGAVQEKHANIGFSVRRQMPSLAGCCVNTVLFVRERVLSLARVLILWTLVSALVGGVLCEHSILWMPVSALVGEGAYSLGAGECSRWRDAV